ncbi:MAG: hypothetical protein ACLQU4_01385 [Limisphaerales bacterium]
MPLFAIQADYITLFGQCRTIVGFLRILDFTHARRNQPAGERLLQNGMAEAGGTLEVGGHHGFQLLHYAPTPLHFRHNPRLLGKVWERTRKLANISRVHGSSSTS